MEPAYRLCTTCPLLAGVIGSLALNITMKASTSSSSTIMLTLFHTPRRTWFLQIALCVTLENTYICECRTAIYMVEKSKTKYIKDLHCARQRKNNILKVYK